MKTKMVNIRLDEATENELKTYAKLHNSTITEIMRNAIKEYLERSELSWEDINHKVIPFVLSFLNDFEIIGTITPDTIPLNVIASEMIPVIISTKKNNKRITFGITFESIEDDILVRISVYNSEIKQLKKDDAETFFYLKRDMDKAGLKETVSAFFNHVRSMIK